MTNPATATQQSDSNDVVDAVALRRDLHRHPEVGFTEFRTSSRAAGLLADLGWHVEAGEAVITADARLGVPDDAELGEAYNRAAQNGADARYLPALRGGLTAVVARLKGSRPGPVLALRADMDALPLNESRDAGHAPSRIGFDSAWPGQMHACGHDGHVAVALALAGRLVDRDFSGEVRLILQPAEEGGRGGAAMVAAGVADDVDIFIAPHLGMGLPTGTVCTEVAGLLANSKLRAVFRGAAAHASMAPEQGRHALLGAALATLTVHSIPPFSGHQTRVNVGALHGGTVSNIVPDYAELRLEIRADDGTINAELEQRVRRMLAGAAATYGLDVDVALIGSVTTASNDPVVVEALTAAAQCVGATVGAPGDGIGSDDATAFMRRVQARGGVAGYFGIGASSPAPHHSSTFDIDEAALPLAVDLLESLVRNQITAK